jgi:hypothetical protein
MKYFLVAAILLSIGGTTPPQEDVKAKHAAYSLCTDNIEKDPHKAYEYCSDYLNKYPNDDQRLTGFAGKFVTAYKKISQYLKSVPMTDFAEKTNRWAVYSPGLLAAIPSEDSRHADHAILIKREYGSFGEEKLLAKAESLYKNPDPIEHDLLKEWRYVAEPDFVLPDGAPKWWTGKVDTILATEVVTTEAVLYYYNTSKAFISKEGILKENSFKFSSSSLEYKASIKKMDVYEHAGKSFNNVYVANMTLTWAQVCGSLCGYGFTRNKIVVMSPSGEILEMFLDDPVNSSSWIS